MKASRELENYAHEQKELLGRVCQLLESDSRVAAAWLFGSLGRGDGDSLSDIDVWVAVEDEHVREVVAEKRQIAAAAAQPTLFFETLERAPENGGYLMVYYEAPTAPHQVDWYWQPRSRVVIQAQTRLLFDRAGLPHGTEPVRFPWLAPREGRVQQPAHFVSSFWVALLATAKYLARGQTRVEKELFTFLLGSLYPTYEYLNIDCTTISSEDYQKIDSPGERLRVLRQLADEMRAMMTQLAVTGEEVPNSIVPGAYQFLDLGETVIQGD